MHRLTALVVVVVVVLAASAFVADAYSEEPYEPSSRVKSYHAEGEYRK